MHEAKIIIADSKDSSRKLLKDNLILYGYQVMAEARNAPDMLRKTRNLYPDLVIIDSNLEGGSAFEIAGIIQDDNIANVLIISSEPNSYQIKEYAHIFKPYTQETLASVVEVCLLFKEKVISMQKEVDKLKESLSSRKLVEQAKGVLMKHMKLSEPEAYRLLQKESMNKGTPMRAIAQAVIEAYENM